VLELPTGGLALDGPPWPWLPTLVLAGLTLPGAALAAAFLRRPAARRQQAAHDRRYFRYIK
jgi:hypothetical protein